MHGLSVAVRLSRRGRTLLVGLVVGSLLLGACGKVSLGTNSGGSSADQTLDPGFSFVRHPLPGAFGLSAIAYPTPPYLVGTANDGRGNLTELDFVKIGDRKSTRLNSSHLVISYAVFCLKKKKTFKFLL